MKETYCKTNFVQQVG